MKLELLDLSPTEQKILKILITHKSITATQIMEISGLYRKVVYDALKKLESRSFIISKKEEKERLYEFSGTSSIKSYLNKLKEEHKEKTEKIKKLLFEIKKINPTEHIDSYSLNGKTGVRYILTKLIEENKNYLVIGAPLESEEIMGETYWFNFHAKQKEKRIKVRAIFNKDLKSWKTKVKNPNIKIKTFRDLEPLTEQIITNNEVITIIWTSNPKIHVVVSHSYASSQREYFEHLWKKAT